jgi:FkbM family methyltransferase
VANAGELLTQRVTDALRRALGIRPRLVRIALLGHSLQLSEGTVRSTPDYDDAWFLACALHADFILDTGANRGGMALLALLCPNVKEVVLVEPNPAALIIASENMIRNHLSSRARFVCAFASDVASSTIRLWTVGAGAAGSMYSGHAVTASRASQSLEVPTVTLDELVAEYRQVPDLVKIDVEGAERLVLTGSRKLAAANRSRFLVEMHSNPELSMVQNAEAVLQWCHDLRYSAWYLARGTRLETPDDVNDRGRCHLLLQPCDWPFPKWLEGISQSAPLEAALVLARG